MSRPKGGKEHPTPHYNHLTLNDDHTLLLWNYSQVGLLSLREGIRFAHFRLMSDVDAGIDDSRPQ